MKLQLTGLNSLRLTLHSKREKEPEPEGLHGGHWGWEDSKLGQHTGTENIKMAQIGRDQGPSLPQLPCCTGEAAVPAFSG